MALDTNIETNLDSLVSARSDNALRWRECKERTKHRLRINVRKHSVNVTFVRQYNLQKKKKHIITPKTFQVYQSLELTRDWGMEICNQFQCYHVGDSSIKSRQPSEMKVKTCLEVKTCVLRARDSLEAHFYRRKMLFQ